MKKALLAFVLLILVVAVSYIKAVRQEERVDSFFQLVKKTTQLEVLAIQSKADSLRTRLGQQEVGHSESVLVRNKLMQKNLDSLSGVIKDKSATITDLKKKTAKSTSAQKSNDTQHRHRELLAFYKKRYQSLSRDLTDYELKVAVSEIRQETASKYLISLTELNRLREKYNFNF